MHQTYKHRATGPSAGGFKHFWKGEGNGIHISLHFMKITVLILEGAMCSQRKLYTLVSSCLAKGEAQFPMQDTRQGTLGDIQCKTRQLYRLTYSARIMAQKPKQDP